MIFWMEGHNSNWWKSKESARCSRRRLSTVAIGDGDTSDPLSVAVQVSPTQLYWTHHF